MIRFRGRVPLVLLGVLIAVVLVVRQWWLFYYEYPPFPIGLDRQALETGATVVEMGFVNVYLPAEYRARTLTGLDVFESQAVQHSMLRLFPALADKSIKNISEARACFDVVPEDALSTVGIVRIQVVNPEFERELFGRSYYQVWAPYRRNWIFIGHAFDRESAWKMAHVWSAPGKLESALGKTKLSGMQVLRD